MRVTEGFLGHEFARGDLSACYAQAGEFTSERINSNESLEPDGPPARRAYASESDWSGIVIRS